MEVLDLSPETYDWWRFFANAKTLHHKCDAGKDRDVENLYDTINEDFAVHIMIEDISRFCAGIIRNLESTQAYEVCNRVKEHAKNAHPGDIRA